MYLKSLEIQGFKSFPDRIKLNFDKGLTAVVGPNGSGKSNIGDAMKWVLGEQSSKSLRGGKMEDVIFAGTQSRKSVGFAEVKLNIDNSDGSLALKDETITIARKLYRSGESEYIINGAQVRLKDVHELFMDTGLGKDGYSIIGQGKVADIVSSKSDERREIFEEAAGISKLRYKKSEAVRNLLHAEDNLVRLKDIMQELESRVGPLKNQSEKAEKFLKLSEIKKNLEISLWISKLDELKLSLKSCEEKLLISTNEFSMLENDLTKIDEQIEIIFDKKQQCAIEIEGSRNSLIEIERNNSKSMADIAVYQNDILHLSDSIKSYVEQIEKINNSTQSNNDAVNELKEKLCDIEIEKGEIVAEIEEISQEFQKSNDENTLIGRKFSQAQADLNALYIQKSELNYIKTSYDNAVADTKKQYEELFTSQDEIFEALSCSQSEKLELEKAIEAANEALNDNRNKLNGYSKIYENKVTQLNEISEKTQQIKVEVLQLKNKSNLLSDLEKNMEGYSRSVKEVIKAGKNGRISGIHGPIAQIIQVEKKYTVAIETALGASIQNIVVDNEDIAKRCISLLKASNSGRATFLPLTSIRGNKISEPKLDSFDGYIAIASELVGYDEKYLGIINSALGRTVVAEDIETATIIAKSFGYRFRIVTLDGQIINAGGSFTGGSVSKSTGVISRKNEIDLINNQISELDHTLLEHNKKTSELTNEVAKMKLDIEAIRDESTQIQSDIIRFEGDLKFNISLIEQLNNKIDGFEKHRESLLSKIENDKKALDKNSDDIAKITIEISKKEKDIALAQENIDKSKLEAEQYNEKINLLKVKLAELGKDKENTESQIKYLLGLSENDEQSIANIQAQIKENETTIEQKEQEIVEIENRIENVDYDVKAINSKIATLRVNQTNLEIEANAQYKLQSDKQEQKIQITREMTRLEERRNTISSELDDIVNQLWEQYEMTLSDAIEYSQSLNTSDEPQKELNEVKLKIRNLGSINVAAIEEYKEVSERYEYISSQLNDIEKSKRELNELIDDLTENMKSMFTKCFNEINENFKSIFVELFGGGKAELSLSDPSNVLESGIDINVAPPGKVIKNLSLLSGGEQAFVAIAIYFSILKIKPSPFCILDEIEAALDDINVTKYASYLRNFTDTTQFILITHRRGTMELSDVLYGVTMQQKGISKVLRMDVDAPKIELE